MAREFIQKIIDEFQRLQCKTLLDLGVGHCAVTGDLVGKIHYTGIDLKREERAEIICDKFVELDIRNALKYFGKKSFDCVISLDVLEHFEKEESIKILGDSERLAKRLVCHFVPVEADRLQNKIQQYKLCGGNVVTFDEFQKNDLQAHRCSWNKEEFESRGYSVIYYGEPYKHFLSIKEVIGGC